MKKKAIIVGGKIKILDELNIGINDNDYGNL